MREIVINRQSLIPRFLSRYIRVLPEDICGLRIATICVIFCFFVAGMAIGMAILGIGTLLHIAFSFGTFQAAMEPSSIVGLFVMLGILALIGIGSIVCAVLMIKIRDQYVRIRSSKNHNESTPLKTIDTVGEMYKSAKERLCVRVRYE